MRLLYAVENHYRQDRNLIEAVQQAGRDLVVHRPRHPFHEALGPAWTEADRLVFPTVWSQRRAATSLRHDELVRRTVAGASAPPGMAGDSCYTTRVRAADSSSWLRGHSAWCCLLRLHTRTNSMTFYDLGRELVCFRPRAEVSEELAFSLRRPHLIRALRSAGHSRARREHTSSRQLRQLSAHVPI